MMKMFEEMTVELFKEAGVSKEDYPDAWDQCVSILQTKMATLSATMGLSYERADIFAKQKQALVEDLIALKNLAQ
jgi:hypothetical protein